MGMDVCGKSPSSEAGEYFRRNVWGWRPLADLACDLAPEIASGCKYWQSNDGDGLDGPASTQLADALQSALDDGRVDRWVSNRDATVKLMPNETCKFCAGTGQRAGAIAFAHPRCNGCDGRGWNRPWAAAYHVDAADVMDFIVFLRASGGFQIL